MAVVVERSADRDVIRAICTHPAIFPHISDDFFPVPGLWVVPDPAAFRFYVARDEHGVFGFGAFHPRNLACWEAHCGFLPRSYGRTALDAFRSMIDDMLASTTSRLVGEIAIDNRLAIAFAKRAGFVEFGVNQKSKLRGGRLIDQVCLGLSKG